MSNLVNKEEYKSRLIEIIDSLNDQKFSKYKSLLLDPANFGDNYHTTPNVMSFRIKSTGETAFQRALIKTKRVLLNFKNGCEYEPMYWIDGELPIVLNKNPRRPCLDLFGSLDGIPTICELKFSDNSNSDSPYYAAIELLTYYCLILFNIEPLDKHKVHHKNLGGFEWSVITRNGFPRLLVCGNKSYWDSWFKKIDKDKLISTVFDWGCKLDTNINLFQSEDYDFKKQKGESEQYEPNIPNDSIWEIVKI